jgi:hypothetical protein
LESSGKIGRLTDYVLLLGRSCSNQVADHNKAGRDPDPNLQRRTGMRCELWNRLDKTERGTNRALRIMLMRSGIAEIGENAVAHVFRDEATIALEQFRAAAMIGADDAPQVLGVELSRKRGRADQVTKHYS